LIETSWLISRIEASTEEFKELMGSHYTLHYMQYIIKRLEVKTKDKFE